MESEPRPTGTCWCGCGEETGHRSFFAPGHDRRAEAAIVRLEYGSVARLVEPDPHTKRDRNSEDSVIRTRLPMPASP